MKFRPSVRLRIPAVFALLAPLAASDIRSATAPAPTSRPNILFCLADDASYPHMSAYGCKWVKTPGFDRLAREGILFRNAYTPNAKCAPSRSCILTGRNPWQLEAAANHIPFFPEKFRSVMEALSANGYFTGHTAKGWGPGNAGEIDGRKRELTGPAFNKRTAEPPTREINRIDYAANFQDFLDAKPADRPFCFWYGSTEPHRGYEFGSGIRLGGRGTGDIDRVFGFWPDNETVRTDMLDYAFEIEHFDRHLQRMLAQLEARGELDNTIVIATADNGMPFPRSKGQSYEVSTHMPLAIMWKNGIKNPGRTADEFVSFIDFAPTFLQAAGLDSAAAGMQPVQGRSLFDVFQGATGGPATAPRDHVLLGRERNDIGRPHDEGYPIRGIVKDGFLFLMNFEPSRWPAANPETGYLDTDASPTKTLCIQARTNSETRRFWAWSFGKRPPEELYDLKTDPDALRNLAGTVRFTTVQTRLKRRMLDELKSQGDPRASGNGAIFDAYPHANVGHQGFYEKFMRGEKPRTGWIDPTDLDPAAAAEEKSP